MPRFFCYKHTTPPCKTMKTTSFILSMLAAGTAAAAALPDYPVVYSPESKGPVQNPAYTQNKPAATTQPKRTRASYVEEIERYTLDLNIGYGFRATPHSKFACDIVTFELEGAYYLVPHHALTLSLGYGGGGSTNDYWVREHHDYYPFTDSYDRSSLTLMGGYRFTHMLGRYVMLQLGAKCGLDVQTLEVDYGYGWRGDPYYDYTDGKRNTSVGMAYAGYAQLGAFVTPSTCLHLGYQFRGSTARPAARSHYPDMPPAHTSTMRWHEVRFGVTYHF